MGGVQAAVAFYKNASTPNLIIIESLLDRTDLLSDLDHLAAVCDPGTKVIAIGHVNDVLLYRDLLRRGVSDYVVAPAKVLRNHRKHFQHLYRCRDGSGRRRSSLLSGPREGPLSTVCHNAAFAMASASRAT